MLINNCNAQDFSTLAARLLTWGACVVFQEQSQKNMRNFLRGSKV
jgi:hypothetical protein